LENRVLPAVQQLKDSIKVKMDAFQDIVKIGRTHLQDATPLTLGQEISGWHRMLEKSESMITERLHYWKELAIGGTAVGRGLNAHPEVSERVCEAINEETSNNCISTPNKSHTLTSHDEPVHTHGPLKALAADLMKIANDVLWFATGPRCSIGE